MNKLTIPLIFLFVLLNGQNLTELKDIKLRENQSSHSMILSLSESPEYFTSEIYKPPSLVITLPNVLWTKDNFFKISRNSSLYEFKVSTRTEKTGGFFTEVRLLFYSMPEYLIETEDNDGGPVSLIITWPKIDHFPDAVQNEISGSVLTQSVSLNFKNASLANVVRLIATQNNLNLVLGSEMEETINISLEDVSLQTALNAILKVSGYDWFVMDNIIVIKPIDLELDGELKTKIYELKFVEAKKVQTALRGLITNRAIVIPFSSGLDELYLDRIMITDKTANFPAIETMINNLDQRQQQINISVKFIETTLSENERMGINWSLRTTMYSPVLEQGETSVLSEQLDQLKTAQLSLPAVTAILDILASDNSAKLLQEPQITTFNNSTANIQIGTSIPILVPQGEGSVFGTNPYTFENQNVNIALNVLPRINGEGLISMKVDAAIEAIIGYTGPNADRPIVSSRSTKTNVMVRDGETLLIGGLIFEDDSKSQSRFPFLSTIPIIKTLFNSRSLENSQRELLIFITPTIIS